MKKLSITLFLILAFCAFCFAQSKLPEFDKAKEIKLLKSTREDVKKIFADFEHDEDENEDYEQYFSTKNAEIEVIFSVGNCADENSDEIWNVAEWKVTKIKITPEETLKLEDFKFDFSSFTKEIENEETPEYFKYHNENAGIVFEIYDGEISKIIIYPPKSNIAFLCANEKTSEIISGEKRLVDSILEYGTGCINKPPNVDDIISSAKEIIISCENNAKNRTCKISDPQVSIFVMAVDPENDVLTYNYETSAGKIIGQGAKVIWDLTGVKPGSYTITAWADDGCGKCGSTITKTVVVKEQNVR